MPDHLLIQGDSRSMHDLSDASVHLIVTSPPYWQLKDYGPDNQIGFHSDFHSYIDDLNQVWSECFRVLHEGCRMCVNIGDQFARSVYYGRYKIISIQSEIIHFCEMLGFDYMGTIIWQKVTTVNTTGGAVVMGSFPYPRNGIVKMDYEYILLFKKPGTAPRPTKAQKEASVLTTEEWNKYFYGHWNFPGVRHAKHIAPFPVELPRRLIKMFSFVGDTVLDPFVGSGTTSVAAAELERGSVGYELNPEFVEQCRERLADMQSIEIRIQEPLIEKPDRLVPENEASIKISKKRQKNLDKTNDPRQNTYGSVITSKTRK
ncbi:MAG: site-specific DNA-methyltransferase [Fimbriimonadaceae bacterium]|nr:site-specific DNA-methyltransferase [Fimbriimonadaceae bacterium]